MGINSGYQDSITISRDDDGFVVLVCPADSRHMFKGFVDQGRVVAALQPDPFFSLAIAKWCPYCGHRCSLRQLAPFLDDRYEAAKQRIAARAAQDAARELGAAAADLNRAGGFLGLQAEVTITKQPAPFVRSQPSELTRLDLICSSCGERVAIYGRASYCWQCGPLPPDQVATEGLRALRGRLNLLDRSDVPGTLRDFLTDHGLHESLEWDAYVHGVALIEGYLLSLYEVRTQDPEPRASLSRHVLPELALPTENWPAWNRFKDAQEIRNSIVHRGGRVDAVLHEKGLAAGQAVGERLRISRSDALELLDQLSELIILVRATQAVHGNGEPA